MMEPRGTNAPHKVYTSGARTVRTTLVGFYLAQRKLVHARDSFLHHSDDRVDLLVQKGAWRIWRHWTSSKGMSLEKTSRARPPYLHRLKDYRGPKRTNVPPHVNRIVAFVLCQNHRGKQLVHLSHHHGSTQVPKKALYRGDLWELSRPRKLALAIFHPPKALWHFSQKVNLAVRKMSRPDGMLFRPG